MTTHLTPSRRMRPALAAAGLAALLLLGACSSSSDDSSGGDGGGVGTTSMDTAERAAPGAPEEAAAEAGSVTDGDAAQKTQVAQRSVISQATVSLSSDDVAGARFDVQKIVDTVGGEVAEEQTEGGEDMRRSRLVVRVPSADFSETVTALEKVGELESSTRKSEDVTTTVIDNEARIRAQEQSLRRVEVLLGRATSIRDIVAIESQLTQRQAELDSLKSQQAFLADQTSLSTITVHIERTGKDEKEEPETDETGFFSGLEGGWEALTTFGTGLATVAGAVLPFAVVLGLLGVPAWVLLRRFARRRPTQAPAAPAASAGA